MPTIKQFLILIAVTLALAACGSTPTQRLAGATRAAPAASKDPTVAKPVFHVGDMWTFRRVDLWRNETVEKFVQELRLQDGDRWTVQWRITDTEDPRRRGSVTGEYLDGRTLAFADAKMKGRYIPLSFPLHVGKTWKFSYNYTPEHHRDVAVEQVARVAGWEVVTVPAGRFRALKVVHEGRYSAVDSGFSWNGDIHEVYWYAPEVRQVVKKEYRDTKGDGAPHDQWRDELVSMRLAEPATTSGTLRSSLSR